MCFFMRSLSKFIAIVSIALVFVSCHKPATLNGSWKLSNFCYGGDCIEMGETEMVQIWEFSDVRTSDGVDTTGAKMWFDGRQSQDSTMDISMTWRLTPSADTGGCDTLVVVNKLNKIEDTFWVTRLDRDTLELSSMLKNMLVRQIFVRM